MDLLVIVAIPFAIATLLALPAVKVPKPLQTWGIPAVMIAMFGQLLRRFPAIEESGAYAPPPLPWIPELGLHFSFYLDGLSLLFALVVTGIGAVIFFYTGFYFDDAKKQTRFNMWLSAFAGAMLGVVLSGNFVITFIMWELTSITSFMLIGFYGNKDETARYSARRALVITGGGGLALVAGVILLAGAVGQTLQEDPADVGADGTAAVTQGVPFTFEYTDMLAVETLTDHPWFAAIAVLMMLAAFTKSAQFPFHFWLPGAMTAPTPASAYLHSATMVKAGIYLLARLHPVMYDDPLWINGLVAVGGITMLISALFALKQRDLKGLLAYSTTSWLGVLVMLIGLPSFAGFKALAIGILAHALYKSALFLSVGSIDHSVETRLIDKLGGMWKYMPATGVVVILSALSMAGVPFFFGFLAKEVLLDATVAYMAAKTFLGGAAIWVVAISAALTGTAGYILIYDVFFAKQREEVHYHAMPRYAVVGPMLLAVGGTTLLPFALEPLLVPLVEVFTPNEVDLHLFPVGGMSNQLFQISLAIIAFGLVVFAIRRFIVTQAWQFLPFTGAQAYQRLFLNTIQRAGDFLVLSQNGRVRYYLFLILGIVAVVITSSNINQGLPAEAFAALTLEQFDTRALLNVMLIVLGIGATLFSVISKRHLLAALAVSVFGFSVAGIFLVEGAPDVALVQFLVETLSTVLIVIMIGRISHRQRKKMADTLWGSSRGGVIRDALIATGIGFSVFIFALTAIVNRPGRVSIAQWYLENTEPLIDIPDVVAAIVSDFRGMDTMIEIVVFGVASLGVLALLAVNRQQEGVDAELPASGGQQFATSTPFTQTAALLVFPAALLVGLVHLLYGGEGPGDGFTAGVIAGLGIALGYIVFGYDAIRQRVKWLNALGFLTFGLLLSVGNAVAPLLFGQPFLYHWSLKGFEFAGLHIASSTVFELAIATTVFGAVGVILGAIAHPRDVEVLAGDELYDPNYGAPPREAPLNTEQQPAGAD